MLRLVAPDGTYEIRHVSLDGMRIGVSEDVEYEVLYVDDHDVALFACDHAGYLQASVEGGGFSAVPTDVKNGFDLGAGTAGQRKTLTVRVTIPGGTDVRDDVIEYELGIGV